MRFGEGRTNWKKLERREVSKERRRGRRSLLKKLKVHSILLHMYIGAQ